MPNTKQARGGYREHSRVVVLLGAPGSGKGTQSSLLTAQFGISSLSTGAMLREDAKQDTPAGVRLRRILATGALVDDATVCEAVAGRLRAFQSTGGSLILDGFPRTVAQARTLVRLLKSLGMPAPLVLHLDVPYDVLHRRLAWRRQCATCGEICNLAGKSARGARCPIDGGALVEREDDAAGIVSRRLAAYEAETLPVLEYFRGGDYRRIDGDRPADEIAEEMREMLGISDAAVAA